MMTTTATLNPIKFHPRFSHIADQIFKKLDKKSLGNCKDVVRYWLNLIDNHKVLWMKIVKKEEGNEAFQFACKTGHIKMVQMLIKRSARFKIDLNAKIVRFS